MLDERRGHRCCGYRERPSRRRAGTAAALRRAAPPALRLVGLWEWEKRARGSDDRRVSSTPPLREHWSRPRRRHRGLHHRLEQRRVIARVLAEAVDHPDVEELYRRCVAVDDKISISTVYRTVKLLEDAGIIERHDFREGRARYEQMRDSHHDHLINLRDGKVIEFTSEEIEKLQAEIAASSATSWSITGLSFIASRSTTISLDRVLANGAGSIYRVNYDRLISSLRLRWRAGRQRGDFLPAHAETLTRHGYPIPADRCLIDFLGRPSVKQLSKSRPIWQADAFLRRDFAEDVRGFAASCR